MADEITNVEKELLTLSGLEPSGEDRQKDLQTLVRKVTKLSDDDIDTLSSPAQSWLDEAIEAMNNNTTVPEIGDDGPIMPGEAAQPEETATNGNAEEPPEEEAAAPEAPGDTEEPAAEEAPAEEQPAEAQDKPKKSKAKKAEDTSGKKKSKTSGARSKAVQAKEKKGGQKKPAKKQGSTQPSQSDKKDKFGLMASGDRSRAAKMFENGPISMRDVSNSFDGEKTFYNLLRKLEQEGHRIEKDGHKIKLVHKGEVRG